MSHISVADPDRVTGFLEPGQKFQIWMKMDKNLIFCVVFLTQNPVKILSRSATAFLHALLYHISSRSLETLSNKTRS